MLAISRNGRMAEEFQRRLDSILGALDQHDPQSSAPSWSISDRIVQNRGQDPSDSESEDEREHQECIQVLCDVEEEEGNGLGPAQLPSSSACKAFEKEEEEDEFDRLACESLQKLRCRPKPALKTQVAERNIYDRMTSKISTPTSPSSPASPQNRPRSERKKVRFRVTDEYAGDSPAITPSATGNRSHCTTPLQGPSPRVRRKLIDGEAVIPETASLVPSSGPSGLPSWQSAGPQASQVQQPAPSAAPALISAEHPRSHVPEHVRRPQAFTCYALDVPVTVGSGNDGLSASSAASAASAAFEYMRPGNALAAPGPSTSVSEPAPGVIQFVPRVARDDGGAVHANAAGAARPGPVDARAAAVLSSVSAADSDMEDVFDGMEGGDDLPAGIGMIATGHTVHASVPLEAMPDGPPCVIDSGALFAGKGGKHMGRKMRARTTEDD